MSEETFHARAAFLFGIGTVVALVLALAVLLGWI